MCGRYGLGKFALVDDEDFEVLNKFKWHLKPSDLSYNPEKIGYAKRGTRKEGKYTNVIMHRVILKAEEGEICDHANGNTLDNRKENLRICTFKENSINSKKPRGNTSGFKGVSWNKPANKWIVFIAGDTKRIYLGLFSDKLEAAKVYNEAALKYHGEFARLNVI